MVFACVVFIFLLISSTSDFSSLVAAKSRHHQYKDDDSNNYDGHEVRDVTPEDQANPTRRPNYPVIRILDFLQMHNQSKINDFADQLRTELEETLGVKIHRSLALRWNSERMWHWVALRRLKRGDLLITVPRKSTQHTKTAKDMAALVDRVLLSVVCAWMFKDHPEMDFSVQNSAFPIMYWHAVVSPIPPQTARLPLKVARACLSSATYRYEYAANVLNSSYWFGNFNNEEISNRFSPSKSGQLECHPMRWNDALVAARSFEYHTEKGHFAPTPIDPLTKEPLTGEQRHVYLIPGLDFVNHAERPNCKMVAKASDTFAPGSVPAAVELVAVKDISFEEELTVQYPNIENYIDSMLWYGFIDGDRSTISLPLQYFYFDYTHEDENAVGHCDRSRLEWGSEAVLQLCHSREAREFNALTGAPSPTVILCGMMRNTLLDVCNLPHIQTMEQFHDEVVKRQRHYFNEFSIMGKQKQMEKKKQQQQQANKPGASSDDEVNDEVSQGFKIPFTTETYAAMKWLHRTLTILSTMYETPSEDGCKEALGNYNEVLASNALDISEEVEERLTPEDVERLCRGREGKRSKLENFAKAQASVLDRAEAFHAAALLTMKAEELTREVIAKALEKLHEKIELVPQKSLFNDKPRTDGRNNEL